MSLAKCIVLSFFCIGFALVGAVCLTFFLGFLCCWDANRKPRKQWFLLFPILCLVLIPGVLLRNECQGKLEWFEGFDYYGDMLVLACGGHYHEYATCATHAMSSCATTKGEFVVTWNTTNTTTGMPLTCKSLVWQPSCEKDICMYDSDVKKDYRCPYANDEAAINQSLAETTQCMLDRYQSTTFPVQCDWMAESHIFIELYGNSKTCEATIPPEHEEPKFFKNMYKRGDIMVTSSWVVLGLIFVGSFVEYFYLKGLAAVQAADSAEAHEASATLEMAPSFDFSADDFSAEIHPVETANCNDEVKDLPRIV